jgi:RNA-directed DNA polymerase
MTEMNKSLTGAPTAKETNWDSINWNQAKSEVKRLQMRIAKAMREKRYGKVRALQRLLSHSFYGKSIAVKRVTQNKGRKCPGIDGIVWRTKRQKMQAILSIKRLGYKSQPLRRIYIPKKNGRRPLSIPTMKDRAMQALHLLGLEPVAESIADKNSYGFRPKRSAADAIAQCYNSLCRKNSAKWIFEGDIESFFDRVDFSWLEKNILMDKVILKRFLRAGYVEKTSIEATTQGVPQGGLISPVIALITLSGLEEQLAQKFKRNRGKVNMIIYADDFVITGESKELLENDVIPIVEEFLAERGLQLSQEKSHITHISQGFNFLGFHVRKYGKELKFLTKPSKASVKTFLADIKRTIQENSGANAENLIRQLNPKIIGWTNYYKHSAASKTFSYIDNHIFKKLYRWIGKRHQNKGQRWTYNKYFQRNNSLRRWHFHAKFKDDKQNITYLNLRLASDTKIVRHTKTLSEATPYDPKYFEYFQKRENDKRVASVVKSDNRALSLINA